MKRCALCGIPKPHHRFHYNYRSPDKKHPYCKDCRRHPNPEEVNRPELLEDKCWYPGCCRPSLDGDCICAYHECVFVEQGAR